MQKKKRDHAQCANIWTDTCMHININACMTVQIYSCPGQQLIISEASSTLIPFCYSCVSATTKNYKTVKSHGCAADQLKLRWQGVLKLTFTIKKNCQKEIVSSRLCC